MRALIEQRDHARTHFRIRNPAVSRPHIVQQMRQFVGRRNDAADRRMRNDELQEQLAPARAIDLRCPVWQRFAARLVE